MKNNKGFTMVELLAVVIILSLIMVIVYPSVNNILSGGRNTVDKLTLENIEDSATMFAQDIYICDNNIINILKNDLNYSGVSNCKDAKEKLQQGITITMNILRDYEYISRADKCNGNIILKMNGDKINNITVNVDNITCE